MPPTFSVSTSIAVVPTVPPGPATGGPVLGVPGVLGAPGLAQADAGAADFLDQFKAALKNLTKAVSLPHLAAKMAQHVAAPEQAPGAQAAPAAAQATDSPPVDHQAESLPDVLAALGFVLAPIAFQAPATPPPTVATAPISSAGDKPALTAPIASTSGKPAPIAAATAMSGESDGSPVAAATPPISAAAPGATPTTNDASTLAPADTSMLASASVAPTAPAQAAHHVLAPSFASEATTQVIGSPQAADHIATQPVASETRTRVTGDVTPGALVGSRQTAHHVSAPSSASEATTQVIDSPQTARHASAQSGASEPTTQVNGDVTPEATVGSQQTAQQGAFQQGSPDDDDHQSTPRKTTARVDSASVQDLPHASDSAITAAASSTAPTGVALAPAHVRPGEVISQIAHQADLYRLPGNRGVRIQLHPEGLGGVQVTMRYGVGGGLQLHINVEHAATGSLVEAGWTQLRDALATQGISPERLVMSVTAPTGSSQRDFSGAGSDGQNDPRLADFAHSQSGQQRQDQPEQTRQRGWNSAAETTSSADDNPRVASAMAVTSRIDYRA